MREIYTPALQTFMQTNLDNYAKSDVRYKDKTEISLAATKLYAEERKVNTANGTSSLMEETLRKIAKKANLNVYEEGKFQVLVLHQFGELLRMTGDDFISPPLSLKAFESGGSKSPIRFRPDLNPYLTSMEVSRLAFIDFHGIEADESGTYEPRVLYSTTEGYIRTKKLLLGNFSQIMNKQTKLTISIEENATQNQTDEASSSYADALEFGKAMYKEDYPDAAVAAAKVVKNAVPAIRRGVNKVANKVSLPRTGSRQQIKQKEVMHINNSRLKLLEAHAIMNANHKCRASFFDSRLSTIPEEVSTMDQFIHYDCLYPYFRNSK